MVGGVGEEEHGGVRSLDPDETDGGPASLCDDTLQFGGELGVHFGEVPDPFLLCTLAARAGRQAASDLVGLTHLQKAIAKS